MNKQIERKIGNNIRTIREKRGITQDLLASKLQLVGCDITRSAIAKIEVGQRHLYLDELLFIKEILNTTFDEIFYIEQLINNMTDKFNILSFFGVVLN